MQVGRDPIYLSLWHERERVIKIDYQRPGYEASSVVVVNLEVYVQKADVRMWRLDDPDFARFKHVEPKPFLKELMVLLENLPQFDSSGAKALLNAKME